MSQWFNTVNVPSSSGGSSSLCSRLSESLVMTQGPLGSILWVCPAWHLHVDDATCKDTQKGKAAAVELGPPGHRWPWSELTTWPPGLRREAGGGNDVPLDPGLGWWRAEGGSSGWSPLWQQFTFTVHITCSLSLRCFSFNKSLINTQKRASSSLAFAKFLKCFLMNYFILYIEWYHRIDGHEFEQAPGVGDGQRSLACCSPWGRKESDMTERLNWTELNWYIEWDLLLRLGTTDNPGPVGSYLQFCLQVMLIHVFGLFSCSHFWQNFFFPPLGW